MNPTELRRETIQKQLDGCRTYGSSLLNLTRSSVRSLCGHSLVSYEQLPRQCSTNFGGKAHEPTRARVIQGFVVLTTRI